MVFRVSLVRLIINTLILRPIPHRGLDWQVFYFFFIFGTAERTPFARKTELKLSGGKPLLHLHFFAVAFSIL